MGFVGMRRMMLMVWVRGGRRGEWEEGRRGKDGEWDWDL